MRTYKAVIFDVGDTLLYTWPSRAEAMRLRLTGAGFAPAEADMPGIMAAISAAERAQIAAEQAGAPRMNDKDYLLMVDRAALNHIGVADEAALAKLNAIPLPETELRVIAGIHEMLQRLKRSGIRMAVVSNHYRWLRGEMERLGLAPYFETMVISEEVGVEKPDPAIMRIALSEIALEPADSLYVGDHPYDVLCAGRAGMDCAWIAPPEAGLPADVPYKEVLRLDSAAQLADALGM